ncbi:MAG: glycosyltransferase family 4 protein [bacterium]|nr:glycosyltransferase family 4 protein [bacterium]
MRIGLLLPSVYMGAKYENKIFAPKELFLSLANGLVDRGHEVYAYAAPNTKTKAHLITGEEELIEHDFISPKFRGLDRLAKLKNAHTATKIEYEINLTVKACLHAKEKKLDIMHSYLDFVAHYVNRLVNIPTVYTIHDPRPRREHLEYWRFRHFKNDNYIFISHSQVKNFKGLIRTAGVIYHGIKVNKFPFSGQPGEYLAFLGRYIEAKGIIDAIAATKRSNSLLKMIGEDAYRALPYYKNRILPHLKKGVVEDETFFGKSDRGPFLKNAKALLFPIQWEEPFGMVMIEAMACGTPVIAYNRGSVAEIIKDGLTGFIIDQDEKDRPGKGKWVIKKQGVAGLVEAINRIGEIDRNNCRKHIEENFSIEKMVKGYEEVYTKVINTKLT